MLRSLVVLVLLANAVFFAWAQGWLAPAFPAPVHGEREPARLQAQLRPETITVLSAKAASAAVQAARAASAAAGEGEQCVQLGPYADTDVAAAEAQLVAIGLPREAWERRDVPGEVGRVLLRLEKLAPTVREQLRAVPALATALEGCPFR
jgi:hypothetical protein